MRRAAARAGLLMVLLLALLGAGTCALPRPGLAPTARVRADAPASVVVAASTRYRAGALRRALLGRGYRDLWAAPVRVDLLDLAAHAGGLAPLRRGGGNQTRSLRFRGADGREYVFRSLDKDQGGRLGAVGRATIGRVRQDQIGALHPGAALVAAGVAEAAGVLHAPPRLFLMPDDPALGTFRGDFGGMLGLLQEAPDAGFAGAGAVVDTEELWPALRARPADRVDARAFLTARLVDVYLGDWDRHDGQWRWARFDSPAGARWAPIPRDRDYALADYRGLLPGLARRIDPKVVRFDGAYRDLEGLLVTARALDCRLVGPLPPAAWDSAALALRGALTDDALAAAVARMPPEYVRLRGTELAGTLRERRDRLPEAARRFRAALHRDGHC